MTLTVELSSSVFIGPDMFKETEIPNRSKLIELR